MALPFTSRRLLLLTVFTSITLLQAALFAVLAWISSIASTLPLPFLAPLQSTDCLADTAARWGPQKPSQIMSLLCSKPCYRPYCIPSKSMTYMICIPPNFISDITSYYPCLHFLQLYLPPCCSSETLESSYPGGFALALLPA